MEKFSLFIKLLIFSLLLAACSNLQPTQASLDPTPTAEEVYPAPGQFINPTSPYPAQDENAGPQIYATSGPVPAPADDRAVLTGRLLVEGKPVFNVYIALAEVVLDEEGQERVVSYDQFNAPKGLTDAEGRFVLADVIPDRYGLILDTVISSVLLNEPDDNEPFLITAEAGKTLDLGDLDFDDTLPVPQDQIAP
jgi:hypothetical protein